MPSPLAAAQRTSLAARVGTWVIALLVGVIYGLAGTIAHSFSWGWVPVGLVLAIVGSAALLAAVRLLTSDRWSALAAGLGMMAATLVFSGQGPGGSVIVPQTSLAVVWTIAVPILVSIVVAWPEGISMRRPETAVAAEADGHSN